MLSITGVEEFEPSLSASKADVLLRLDHTPLFLQSRESNPVQPDYEPGALPLRHSAIYLVEMAGIEPASDKNLLIISFTGLAD